MVSFLKVFILISTCLQKIRFYVNIHTKASQWEKPTAPAVNPNADGAPPGPPPSYNHSDALSPNTNEKQNPNNPYNKPASPRPQSEIDADARYAAQLQAEENARAGGSSRGAADSYYNQGPGSSSPGYGHSPGPASPPGYDQQQQQGDGKRGFFSKLMGKGSNHGPPPQQYQQGYPPQQSYQQGYQQGYPQQGYPPQGGYGGYGGPPPGNYGGYPPQPGYGYTSPPPQQYVQQQPPPKKSGLGAGGGAALGLGAGLLGGALLTEAFESHENFEEEQAYQQGYDQGYDNGDNGDYGGGDDF
jgi:hypothetical protein